MDFSFYLKKLVSLFMMPLPFCLLLFFIGLLFLYTKSYKKANVFLTFSFLLSILFSSSSFSNKMIYSLEKTYPKIDSSLRASYIVLLGGDFENRAYEVLRLKNLNKDAIIITSGYGGSSVISEAFINKQKFISLGINEADILIQENVKDTIEEARALKKLLKDEKFFLVTSSYHMKRTASIFKKEGLNPYFAPSDSIINDNSLFSFAPSSIALIKTKIAFHEYLGIIWNYIKSF